MYGLLYTGNEKVIKPKDVYVFNTDVKFSRIYAWLKNWFIPSFIFQSKGDWGHEIWSRSLLPIGSKTLAKVERPFGCAGCMNSQSRPVRIGTLNPMPRECHALCTLRTLATALWGVRRWPDARQNFCPYPIYPHFLVAVQISPTIIPNVLINLFSSWTCMKFSPLDVKKPTINQSIFIFRSFCAEFSF